MENPPINHQGWNPVLQFHLGSTETAGAAFLLPRRIASQPDFPLFLGVSVAPETVGFINAGCGSSQQGSRASPVV